MTKINEAQSKEIYNLWLEGNLSKKQVAERYNVSEDVVKFHIKKNKIPALAQVEEGSGEVRPLQIVSADAPKKGLLERIKEHLGTGDKDQVIAALVSKIDELNAAQIPIAVQRDPQGSRKYICTRDEVVMYTPAVFLHKGQSFQSKDTTEVLEAISNGTLISANAPGTAGQGVSSTILDFLRKRVVESFERYYEIAAPCTKDKVTRFVTWYRATEGCALSDEAVRDIVTKIVLEKTGNHKLVLSHEEELDRLRSLDKKSMLLCDLRKIDEEAYIIRLVTESLIRYTDTPTPLEYGFMFVDSLARQHEEIPREKIEDIIKGIVTKNKNEQDEANRLAAEIMQQRRGKQVN